jgi:soluble lytic murein transglycosylase
VQAFQPIYRLIHSAGPRSGAPIAAALWILFQTPGSPPPQPPQQQAALPANLEPLDPRYPPDVERALKTLGTGVEHYRKGRHAEALHALSGAAETTAVGDYQYLYRARAALALGHGEEALKDYRLVRSRYPDSPLKTESILGEAQALLKLGDYSGALAALNSEEVKQNSEVIFLQARAHDESGRRDEAVSLYQKIYADLVNSPSASLAETRLKALAPGSLRPTRSFNLLLRRAENLMTAGRNREARAVLLRLGQATAPDRSGAQRRTLLFAEAEYRLGKGLPVLTSLNKITGSDPELHPRAMYLRGITLRRIEREASFLETSELARSLYPSSPWTEKLLLSVATYFDVEGRMDRAREAYKYIRDGFPQGDYAERARWKVAFYSFALGSYEEALEGFLNHAQSYPDSLSAAAYWMARCCEKLGDTAAASYIYRRVESIANTGYYGLRAVEARSALEKAGVGARRAFRGTDFSRIIQLLDRKLVYLPGLTQPSDNASRIIERARRLIGAGLPDLATAELQYGISRCPEEKSLSYALSRLYAGRGDFFNSIVTIRRAFPDYDERERVTLPEEVWELLFPVRHWNVISANAAKNGIDPNLVLGIIRQESAFQESARSRANARGLMQLLPSTGRILARDGVVGRYTVSKLYRPEANIVLGTRHLARLLERFEGKVELALAAYNAGVNRAEEWRNDFGTVDVAEFVERVPFAETRGYIKQVLTNKAHYSLITAPAQTAN